MQILLKNSQNETNKFYMQLVNYKEFNKNQGFKTVSDLNLLENELKLTKEKNEKLSQNILSLESNLIKLKKSYEMLENEKLSIESSINFYKNQMENAKKALGDKIVYCQDLEQKVENEIKNFVIRFRLFLFFLKFFIRERQLEKENEILISENEMLKEKMENIKKENLILIHKNNQNLDFEIYSVKIGDLEKQNQLLMEKLHEKNKELVDITEKFHPNKNLNSHQKVFLFFYMITI